MSVTEVKPDTLEMERNVRSWFVVARYNRTYMCARAHVHVYRKGYSRMEVESICKERQGKPETLILIYRRNRGKWMRTK